MDTQSERVLLELITSESSILLSKSNIPSIRRKRLSTWNSIATEFSIGRAEEYTGDKLQKRWRNMVQRVKEKKKKQRATGGGQVVKYTDNDLKILELLGEGNPQIVRIPCALTAGLNENTAPESSESENFDDSSNEVSTARAALVQNPPLVSRKRKTSTEKIFELEEKRLTLEEERISILSDIRNDIKEIRRALCGESRADVLQEVFEMDQ